MKPKVYIETSIISYLTARPSSQLVAGANQLLVHEWWDEHRDNYELFVSEIVIGEASDGDPIMARKRLAAISEIDILESTNESRDLAAEILGRDILPAKAILDVLHISVSAVNEIDFLLTLNCRHIANAIIYRRVERVIAEFGLRPPTVCTPLTILGKDAEIDEG